MKRKHLILFFSITVSLMLWVYQKQKRMTSFQGYESKEKLLPQDYARHPSSVSPLISKDVNLVEPDPQWKNNLHSMLMRELSQGHSIKLTELEYKTIKRFGKKKTYPIVKVEITSPQGGKSIYNAHVDPETGRLMHTWNKTRFEMKRGLQFTHPLAQ